jgi:hypothetical protein
MFVAYLDTLFEPMDSLTRVAAALQQHADPCGARWP